MKFVLTQNKLLFVLEDGNAEDWSKCTLYINDTLVRDGHPDRATVRVTNGTAEITPNRQDFPFEDHRIIPILPEDSGA